MLREGEDPCLKLLKVRFADFAAIRQFYTNGRFDTPR